MTREYVCPECKNTNGEHQKWCSRPMPKEWSILPDMKLDKYPDVPAQESSHLMTPEMEQLRQLVVPTWDGNLISKSARTTLVRAGWVVGYEGWNTLTLEGLKACIALGILKVQ